MACGNKAFLSATVTTFVPAAMRYDEASAVDNILPVQSRAPIYMCLVITCCARHTATLFGEINRESLQRRSAFILFIFPRNPTLTKKKRYTNSLRTRGGGETHRRSYIASLITPSSAHTRSALFPRPPRLVRLILPLSWTGRQM